jgi:mutator protein MutT
VKRIGVAVVEQDGRFLVGVRGPDVPLPGYHEFPGGKLLPGETAEAGAVRECLEESGLRVIPLKTILECRHEYPHGIVELAFVLCRPENPGDSTGSFQWAERSTLASLRFPEANMAVIELLKTGSV